MIFLKKEYLLEIINTEQFQGNDKSGIALKYSKWMCEWNDFSCVNGQSWMKGIWDSLY